jgi:hypothetical protein
MLRTSTTAPAIAGAFMALIASTEFAGRRRSTSSRRGTPSCLVQGRELRRFGIRLTVTPGRTITGTRLRHAGHGAWDWNNGYFCRDLFYGEENLGFNCQLVQVNGETLRFTTDQGQGIYADLTLIAEGARSEVDREPLLLPVAVAHGLRPVATAKLLRQIDGLCIFPPFSASASARCASGGR